MSLKTGTADFYALNHYSSRLVTHGHDPNFNYNSDADYVTSVEKSWPQSVVSSWLFVKIKFISIIVLKYLILNCVLGST